MSERGVVQIVGGGLAGLAAAVRLAETGFRVVVHERRSVLGGRASSSPSLDREEAVDNCQHVMMRCCTALWEFYGRLGVQSKLHFSDRITFLSKDGGRSLLSGAPLPAPLHLAPSFLRFGPLTLRDKQAIARALVVILMGRAGKEENEETFAGWLRRHGQSDRAVAHFWQPVVVSALNEEPERTAAHYAFHLFREGFLNDRRGFEIGIPTVPLSELYQEPAPRFLAAHGGEVCLRSRVDRIWLEDGVAAGVVLSAGTEHRSDYVIAAVPWHALPELLPEDLMEREPYFASIKRLEGSPITAVHLWFDRPLRVPEHCVLLDREVQWVFDKTRPGENSYLGLVVSASRDWLPRSRAEILAAATRDLEAALPSVREARVTRSAVIKEPNATFSPAPGAKQCRPGAVSPIPRLLIAGDWTGTGWPATMESAVRSGFQAATAVIQGSRWER